MYFIVVNCSEFWNLIEPKSVEVMFTNSTLICLIMVFVGQAVVKHFDSIFCISSLQIGRASCRERGSSPV